MIKSFLIKPYGLLSCKLFKWLFSLLGSTITFFYLIGAKPLVFSSFDTEEQIRLAFFYSVPTALIWIIHLFLLQPLLFKQMRIITTFLWLAWIHFVIGMYVYSFSEIYLFDSQFDWYFLPGFLKMVFQIGGMESGVFAILYFGYLTRQRTLTE